MKIHGAQVIDQPQQPVQPAESSSQAGEPADARQLEAGREHEKSQATVDL